MECQLVALWNNVRQIYDGNLMLIFYVLIPYPYPYPHPIFGKNPYPLRFRAKILKKTRSTFRSRTLILKMNPYPLRSRTYNFKTNPFPLRSRFRTWVRERNGYGISTRTPDSGTSNEWVMQSWGCPYLSWETSSTNY